MNFAFSEEARLLQEEARRFLQQECPPARLRAVIDQGQGHDRKLWSGMAQLGWLGAAVPEVHGGLGAGTEHLCVIAEELGRCLAPVPMCATIYLAAELLARHGSQAQRERWLPAICRGEKTATLALFEGPGDPAPEMVQMPCDGQVLNGSKWPVADGVGADMALVAARTPEGQVTLFVVDLHGHGVTRRALPSIEPSCEVARIDFADAKVELLGSTAVGWNEIAQALDRAAVLVAFEQVGGAAAALEMACGHAKTRIAFGREIGSFQAIKHRLADMFMQLELARSNAYHGAWALETQAAELQSAAAAARLCASRAFAFAARENIQIHGGIGFTWEADCHLYFRRAKLLESTLGAPPYWRERLVAYWENR